MAYKDRDKEKAFKANWYLENRQRILDKTRITNATYKKRNRAFIQDYKKSNPCVDCGGYFHHAAMDFDHLDSEHKTMNISRLVNSPHSLDRIILEMGLCELVCANCHRVRTWQRLQ